MENTKRGGQWYRVTHGCAIHEGHPIYECNGCQNATDLAIAAFSAKCLRVELEGERLRDDELQRQYDAGRMLERQTIGRSLLDTSASLSQSAELSARGGDWRQAADLKLAADWVKTCGSSTLKGEHGSGARGV